MKYTLQMFIEDYEGFDWEHGEIVIVDQRKGNSYICTMKNGKLFHPVHMDFSRELRKEVYHWTHTDKTMLIML